MKIREFVSSGGSKDAIESKVEEQNSALNSHSRLGVVAKFGELKVLVKAEDAVLLVSKLSIFFKIYGKKMWLVGAATDYETYKKFQNRFPSLEVDWDFASFAYNFI